jgi:hypothetical protein
MARAPEGVKAGVTEGVKRDAGMAAPSGSPRAVWEWRVVTGLPRYKATRQHPLHPQTAQRRTVAIKGHIIDHRQPYMVDRADDATPPAEEQASHRPDTRRTRRHSYM